MNAEEMAKLFDVDFETNLTEPETTPQSKSSFSNSRSFEDRCSDIKGIMIGEQESESPQLSDNEIITQALSQPSNKDRKEIVPEEPEKIEEEMQEEPVLEETVTEEPEEEMENNEDNPLGLIGGELKAYQDLKAKYPQLNLWNGMKGFRGFYIAKVALLKDFLSLHRLMPIKAMKAELEGTKVDHSVGNNYVTPEFLRSKLDDSFRWRTRILDILGEAHSQLPFFQRCVELMEGKLYLDHDVKPAHRRQGLNATHMRDVEMYLAGLKGLVKQADHIDNLLKAAAESLSRQLSCLQLKEPTGYSMSHCKENESQDKSLDEYDVVDEVIGAPQRKDVNKIDFGGEHDEFSTLGT